MPRSHVLFPYFYKLGCPAGFERAIQGYAIHVLSITYQRLPRSILAEVGLSWLFLTFIVKRWSIIWKIGSCFSSWLWVPHFCFVHLVRLPLGFMSVIVTQHHMLCPFVWKWWSCLGVLAILHFQGEEAELQCSFVHMMQLVAGLFWQFLLGLLMRLFCSCLAFPFLPQWDCSMFLLWHGHTLLINIYTICLLCNNLEANLNFFWVGLSCWAHTIQQWHCRQSMLKGCP
jgi:hypothetical protein